MVLCGLKGGKVVNGGGGLVYVVAFRNEDFYVSYEETYFISHDYFCFGS
jgi:hypothetical protein